MNSNGMQELTDRLSHHMKTWGMGLEDAMSEIVADSCDQILANETVMQHIQETDKNLYTEVKGFVKNLVERIKQAVTGMSGSASRDARALAQSANEIAKVWLGAYDEALTGVVQQETEQMKDSADEKYSKAEKDYQFAPEFENAIKLFKKCVNNNDFTEFKNTYGENSEIIIGETFQVLQDIGVDNKPMVLDQEHLHKGMDKDAKPNHRITPAELMEIIRKANNPVAIIKSRSENRKNDSVVIIVDHLINDDITMVPARVSTEANVNNVSIDVNYMASAYSNDKMHNLLIDAVNTELGLNPNEIGKPGIFYVNKNKADFLKSKGVQFPSPIKNNGLMHKITDNPDFVNQRTLYYKETEKVMNTIRKSQAELDDKNNEGAVAGSKAIDTGNKEQAVTPSTHDIINDMASLVKLDQEYEDAANRGDIKKTTEMLLKKLADTQGVIPFMAPEWDAGEAGRVARQLKLEDPEAIAKAADKMSDYVPDNAVLIPMPGHEGKLTADSWSVKLAEAISERTGRPVVEHIGVLLKNSIVYNTAAGRKSNQIGTHMLLSAGYDNSGNIIYATFNVNRYTHKLQELDVLYTTKKATTKEAAVSMTGALTNDGLSPTASSVISLAEAFEDVKERFANTLPLDVLNILNTQRRVTKDTDLLHHPRAEKTMKALQSAPWSMT